MFKFNNRLMFIFIFSLITLPGCGPSNGPSLLGSTSEPERVWAQQGEKLAGSITIGAPQQGGAVALSADGNTAIVGGMGDSALTGAAWVYTRANGIWSEQQKLVGAGSIGISYQGTAVDLSSDGNTAIIGGPADNNYAGATWIFTRSGATWTQQAKLVGSGGIAISQQGNSVALSHDGNTAAIGAPTDDSGMGAVWVFIRSDGIWSQQGNKLVATIDVIDIPQQGASVDLSGNGNTLILGGPSDDINKGASWVFTRTGGVWFEQAKLLGTGADGDAFQGSSVSLSSDGNTAIVGGQLDNQDAGAAWIFTRSGGAWSQQGNKLVGSGAIGAARQGNSVSVSGDGNTAIIGGVYDDYPNGAAWLFSRTNGVWSQQGKFIGTGIEGNDGAQQGASVAISTDGNTAIVGGNNDNSYQGAAWIFAR